MATFEIIEKQGLKMIKATIDNETIRAEAGALHYMKGLIQLESKAPSAKGFLKSMVTQESIFRPTYTGTGEIFYGPPTFGEYTMMDLNGEAWVLDKGAYVCSDIAIDVGVYANKAISGLLSGEGFFQTKVEGSGRVVIQSLGPLETIDLQNERLAVDGKFAVARQAHLNFSVQKATKGLLSSMTSGEGFLNIIEGTGRVLISPVPNLYANLLSEMRLSIPTATS
ncbi:MAG: AIM24 family protein [Planctomycetes bacterium]|nr:AIM24 family protein [Planctomycetota bacterium]